MREARSQLRWRHVGQAASEVNANRFLARHWPGTPLVPEVCGRGTPLSLYTSTRALQRAYATPGEERQPAC